MNLRRGMLKSGVCTALFLLVGGTLAEPVSHPFFVCGWKSGGPALYDAGFTKRWQLDSPDELSDGWVLPDGGMVYSFSRRKEGIAGVVRLDRKKNIQWEYRVPQGHDNHSCQPLPHGGFLLGECGKDGLWMLEIDRRGKELKRVKVADAPKDIHHAFRAVRKTPQGTYLGTLMKGAGQLAGGHAYEWDASGKLLRTFPSGSFHAVRLANGNTLVSEGHGLEGRVLTEYAPDDSIVWALAEDDLKAAGLSVGMVCGFQRLPNGNTVVSNVAHGKKPLGLDGGEKPKAFEVNEAKEVVWKVPASTSPHNMGSIQVLDAQQDAFKGTVFR
ncbi:hypothetical protein PDESU_02299 [Pontiella desulfatans]|uniref:Uncharacterized protein n=1 Tax=Pontiella desulfatans TaxID=2750659 RepID=A0A6C2U1C2_PONDE|nr:hypothetical protein [Pontiella desulfatans]VGO13742.1 hypothetical protein PDESU_02299 [Pontiella desulfatans]